MTHSNSPSFFSRFFKSFFHWAHFVANSRYADHCLAFAHAQKPQITDSSDSVNRAPLPDKNANTKLPNIEHSQDTRLLQVLSYLQSEARFIDFLNEDIQHYSDADVGAASRQVHAGCSKIMTQFFNISPVSKAEEGSSIAVEHDYNPRETKLTGRVTGQGPYTGIVIHSGWQVNKISLPEMTTTDYQNILAPIEVEVNG